MNICWDFRLFSYGYATRGVGAYTAACARALLSRRRKDRLLIWGERARVPKDLYDSAVTWIPYKPQDWKRDLLSVPVLIMRHRISVLHYWVALGPLPTVGMGLLHPCRAVATIHDLGAECWKGIPFLDHIRLTPYWRAQRILLRQAAQIVCNSRATAKDVARLSVRLSHRAQVLYPPIGPLELHDGERQPFFVALGGAPNKNLDTVLRAFSAFHETHQEYCLIVLGDVDREEEIRGAVPKCVGFEPMSRYRERLSHCTAFVFCSTNEGLGLPPLEAMSLGCPLLLSDIPPLREVAGDSAMFVSPTDPAAIHAGMEEIVRDPALWRAASHNGWKAYGRMAAASVQSFNAYFRDR